MVAIFRVNGLLFPPFFFISSTILLLSSKNISYFRNETGKQTLQRKQNNNISFLFVYLYDCFLLSIISPKINDFWGVFFLLLLLFGEGGGGKCFLQQNYIV